MRKYRLLAGVMAVLVWGVVSGRAVDEELARLDGDVIARIHFAGTVKMEADPKAAGVKELFVLPEATAMREATLDKLATAPFRLLEPKINRQETNNFAPLIRPLLEDLLREESYVEMRGPTNEVPELMLAVKLDNEHAKVWQANLSTVLAAWTGIPVKEIQGDGYTGWELRKHHDPNLIRCLRAGDWVLFGWGWDELKLQPGFLQRIKDRKRPIDGMQDDWLDAVMDWPAFMARHPFTLPEPLPSKLPKMHLSLEGRNTFVRPKLTLLFPEPLGIKMEPWKIPTKIIQNPMVSFTAARGVSPWLGDLPIVKELHPGLVPNQICIWAMAGVPYETQLTMPVPNASNYLAQLAPRLLAILNNKPAHGTTMASPTVWTNNELIVGVPFLNPHLRAAREPAGDFLYGSLFPTPHRTNSTPLPQDLVREIGSKPSLVYYDWEINQERITQWQALGQIYLISAGQPFVNPNAPVEKWLDVAKKKMGNCATEVTLTAPNELTLVRNGPVGFTGVELNMLEYWLDAPGFPWAARHELPPRPNFLNKPPAVKK